MRTNNTWIFTDTTVLGMAGGGETEANTRDGSSCQE